VPTDLIDYGTGAFPLRAEGQLQSVLARSILDGLGGFTALPGLGSEGPEEPVQLLVELPAMTSFEEFAVAPMSRFGCCRGTHIATVTIEGSATSPDEGFEQLASFHIAPEVYDSDQRFPATSGAQVRWLRIFVDGRQVPDPADYRGTAFTELRGYGEQATRVTGPNDFTGIFLTGGGGSGPAGNRIEMLQEGALVRGCRPCRRRIRFDTDALDWSRDRLVASGGGNQQTSINAALREYVEHRREPPEETLERLLRDELRQSAQGW